LAADPVSVRVINFKGLRSFGDVHIIGHSAAFGTKAAGGLTSEESTNAFPENPPTHFCEKAINTLPLSQRSMAPSSVPKLPVD
jgi:hypothetical protein